ncbi:MAG: HlyD family efflux transporter periplasmic adaptor subunit [Planctomycetota bacterium]
MLALQCKACGADAAVMLRCGPGDERAVEASHLVGGGGVEGEDWWRPIEPSLGRVEALGPAVVFRRVTNGQPTGCLVALWAGGAGDDVKRIEVFRLSVPDDRELAHRVRLLELSRSLIDLRSAQIAASEATARAQRLSLGSDLVGQVNAAGSWRGAGLALCNQLARRFDAERVSLGLVSGDAVRLQAVSDTEDVKRRMAVSRDIEAAMEECVDQDAAVPFPCDASLPLSARAAGELADRHGATRVLTMPIREVSAEPGVEGQTRGAVTLERESDRAFDQGEVEALHTALGLVTPRLLDLYEHDRWFGARWARRTRRVAALAVGPRHTWAKLTAIGLAVALAVVTIGRGTDWVEATFTIEPVVQRVVPAPMAGYLSEVNVEPGDRVVGGETVLAKLDASELEVERARLVARRSAVQRRADMAWREGKTAERQEALAEEDEVEAELALIDYRLDRLVLVAPIDGVVVSGDWRKELGRPVEQGMTLFEVAPLDRYRAVMFVPESRVFDVWEGQHGELASASSPDQRLAFEVERVHPVAEVKDEANVFAAKLLILGPVGAEIDPSQPYDPPGWVRSQVQGVAKADAGSKPWIWLWTRDAVNWVRMKLWW